MPELIRKPIQTIKAVDASTSSTPVPRSEASTPTTTVSEKTETETETKPTVSKIVSIFYKIYISLKKKKKCNDFIYYIM